MTRTFCDYCGIQMELNGLELSAQLWNKCTQMQIAPAGEVFEIRDLCTDCSIILNEAIHSALKKCEDRRKINA